METAKRVSIMEAQNQPKKTASPANVRVVVRLRPYMHKDDQKQQGPCVRGLDSQCLEIINWKNQLETLQYQFNAFYGEDSTQKEIYTGSIEPILPHLLNGQNASVFAYGPTGAGKTHTMLGSPQQPGVIPRAVLALFRMTQAESSSRNYEQCDISISMSYLEIYQEKVLDLLEPKNQDLPIREDTGKNIFIPNLTQKTISSFADFEKHFIPASQNRTVACTKMNDRSSRSHSVLLVKVKKKERFPPFRQLTGKMYLIDLAGSEDNRRTGNQGIRLKESGAINSSLFVLSKVVDALNQGLPRIPYRDSKLTRLFLDSLGGSAHSVMITNIAPEHRYYFDTLTALNFAARSKQVVNRPFTRETIQATALAPLKRPQEETDTSSGSSALHKKKPKTEVEEELSPGAKESPEAKELPLSSLLNQEYKNPAVAERLLKLNKMFLKKNAKGIPLLSTPKRERQALLKVLEENQQEIQELKKRQKELEEKTLAAEALLQQSRSQSDLNASDSENTFKDGLRVATRCGPRKQAIVFPLQVCNRVENTQEKGIPLLIREKRKKDTMEGSKNEQGWDINMRVDMLEKGRRKILDVLNSGALKELKCLQMIGDKKAKLIIGWREVNGLFAKVEDLEKVGGFSEKFIASFLKANILTSAAC
ncbi:kinesin-like protein KIF22 [Microcaecilia unicolor]|uniref:Kinesin-like protein n=1 Tax=Microcaecilia unicolor TaxID=1415580 RepID=A0A6P7YNW0_9AMPH|nr:kinesin-like protein KIF22 [Microcaecilia unicolor]